MYSIVCEKVHCYANNSFLCPIWRSWTCSKACSLAALPRLVAPDWAAMAERAASSSGSSREAAGLCALLIKNTFKTKNSHCIAKCLSVYEQVRRLVLFCASDDTLMANYKERTGFALICWDILTADKATELIVLSLCWSQNMVWWPCAEAVPAYMTGYWQQLHFWLKIWFSINIFVQSRGSRSQRLFLGRNQNLYWVTIMICGQSEK